MAGLGQAEDRYCGQQGCFWVPVPQSFCCSEESARNVQEREMGVLGRAQCDDGAGGSALEKLQGVSFLGNI